MVVKKSKLLQVVDRVVVEEEEEVVVENLVVQSPLPSPVVQVMKRVHPEKRYPHPSRSQVHQLSSSVMVLH